MEYVKFKNGEFIKVKDIESACKDFCSNISELFNAERDRNNRLAAENTALKDEHYKDKKIQELEERISQLRSSLGASFRVELSEWETIHKWQHEHMAEAHELKTSMERLQAGGAIGGNWTYEFVPTSIGTVGTCKCGKCGAEFTFQDLM